MSVGTDLGLYFPRDAFNKTSGVAARLFARFYPVNNERWRVYFESGAGLICFKDEYPMPTDQDPRRGTSWNGTTKYGLGGAVNINRSIAFMFGLRHIHVSNGNVKGVERNPSHDSNGFFIGLSVRPIKASRESSLYQDQDGPAARAVDAISRGMAGGLVLAWRLAHGGHRPIQNPQRPGDRIKRGRTLADEVGMGYHAVFGSYRGPCGKGNSYPFSRFEEIKGCSSPQRSQP
jgi:hypothetical protein